MTRADTPRSSHRSRFATLRERSLRALASPLAPIAVIAIALAFVAWSLAWHRAATRRADEALQSLERVSSEARELSSLRARGESSRLGQRPSQDTLARVHATLDAVGLSPSCLTDLAGESDVPLPLGTDPSLRLQTMRLTLEPIRAGPLAAFVAHWRQPTNPWTITRLDLTHDGPDMDQDDRYAARLVIAAAYRRESGG